MTNGERKYKGGWAVMAVDPGGTTGVAEAYVPRRETIAASLKAARIRTWEAKGTSVQQATSIAICYLEMISRAQLKYKIPRDKTALAIESFQLRKRHVELSPVEVKATLEGLLIQHDVNFHEQTPSSAKSFATDARLRSWGLWIVGSPHERDACRHVALFMARMLEVVR